VNYLRYPGDERHRRTLVEQPHVGGDRSLAYGEFLSETGIYGFHGPGRSHCFNNDRTGYGVFVNEDNMRSI
jgi:hypothetical protein